MVDRFGHNVFFINKLPVPSAVTQNADGTYTIFICSQLSDSRKIECYEHELNHIKNHDFEKSDVQEIEYLAHL